MVGATAWGTTLAVLLARNGLPVTLLARSAEEAAPLNADREHARRLPGVGFPPSLVVSGDPLALQQADLVCLAVPAQSMRANLAVVTPHLAPGATLLSASKGIEIATGQRMSEVLREGAPGHPVAALSGPNLSREVAAGLPSTTVIASADAPLEPLRALFHTGVFRVYTTEDIIGVEFGGALKNIIAIAAGIVDALGYGDNAKAAMITRGLAEMTRLGVAEGADPLTFLGLAGVGDLIASSYSALARNRRLGELLGGGQTLETALLAIGATAEGAATTPAALHLARRLGVEMPIAEALHGILYGQIAPGAAVASLLQRDPKPERATGGAGQGG
ncbi:MAG: NAD(P)-dependent glycerol-3-phosphate dehydrogenase [Dehalococcoidia bacterium]|nr:NAD(P)-dependent glycerol-3-phosphate dehydrogenase [Dehalococcoidia bacterium]